jgi:hypothetical protein
VQNFVTLVNYVPKDAPVSVMHLFLSALVRSVFLLSFSTRRGRRWFYFLAAFRTVFLVSHLQSKFLAVRTGVPDVRAAFGTVGRLVVIELGDASRIIAVRVGTDIIVGHWSPPWIEYRHIIMLWSLSARYVKGEFLREVTDISGLLHIHSLCTISKDREQITWKTTVFFVRSLQAK